MSSKDVGTNALISLADVKDYIGIEVKSSADDAVIVDLIDRMTARFESHCDRNFNARSYTEQYDGEGTKYLFPKNYPIISVSSIFDDSDWSFAASTEITSTTYRIQDEICIVRKTGNIFTTGTQNLQVTYSGGYTSIPADIKQAAVEEVSRTFDHRRDVDVTIKSTDENSISFAPKDLLPSTLRVLNRYKNVGSIL